ncbi:hypothetical protein KXR53_32150 [Inquilinus limosus]|uniref:hypothetical protein n=1 Tax=Inquilinus limosus TaxID=171674 RepID=UPI003F144AFD
MNGITRIEPAIAFRRIDGGTAVLESADALADWLDHIYDAILDPRRGEGAVTQEQRSIQLLEIERLLLALAEESSDDADSISYELRSACLAVIARYRDLIPSWMCRAMHA